MRYRNVCLEAVGYHLPDQRLSTRDIEQRLAPLFERIGFPPGRLEQLTGIGERRIWPVGTKPSEIAAKAGEIALERSNLPRNKIDLLIHAGVCRDALEPATASVVHNTLQLDPHCYVFDVSNACVGFLNALTIAANMIELGQIKTALVVSGENAGPIYEDTISYLLAQPSELAMRKSLASLTLGSGAIAYILTHAEISGTRHHLLGGLGQADSSGHHLCRGEGDIHHQRMETNTAEMMRQGLVLSQVTWELFKRELGWDNETPNHIFNHQVSRAHQEKAFEMLSLDPRKGHSDLHWLGNTGTVATPLSLALRADENAFKEGDNIALLGIGSGLNCLMLGVQW